MEIVGHNPFRRFRYANHARLEPPPQSTTPLFHPREDRANPNRFAPRPPQKKVEPIY